MYYKYDKNRLIYYKISLIPIILKSIFLITSIIMFGMFFWGFNQIKPKLTQEQQIIIINEYNKFDEDKLIEFINELNFKFPEIIIAQSRLETNNYTSKIFKENNNLFGMKEAVVRSNLAKGTNKGHAYYNNWRESVIDYALYYSTYLYKLKTKQQYFDYLQQNYAEDPNYVNKLKQLIIKIK